jgi:crotonobetainyl-CoA:carnitine CoA-transferase CaiB-like acyl-CoA transferase
VAATLATRSTAAWLEDFERAGIPSATVNSTEDVLQDPHLAATGFFLERETRHGRMRFPGMPAWFSRTPGQVEAPAPVLGQDGRAVLEEAGFSAGEIQALVAEGALILP